MTNTRKIATVETIARISDIPDADAIVCARVRGWDVVVKRGEFSEGDTCVYIEVDSLLDVNDDRFSFLTPRGTRTDAEGNIGHVLKTARLRGQYSQGLALPTGLFPEIDGAQPGDDVTHLLPVCRWNPPMPAQLAGQVNGRLPSWIPTTDEERIENSDYYLTARDANWVATEKIDGTSTTVYVNPESGDVSNLDPSAWANVRGVCSRNYDLTYNPDQTLWRLALQLELHSRMVESWTGQPVALQGETFGEGIQGNPLKLAGQHFALFTIRVGREELPRGEWPDWALALSVPTVDGLTFPETVEEAVASVDGLLSVYAEGRPAEGVVWRATDQPTVPYYDTDGVQRQARASFKVISRKYLLKYDR